MTMGTTIAQNVSQPHDKRGVTTSYNSGCLGSGIHRNDNGGI